MKGFNARFSLFFIVCMFVLFYSDVNLIADKLIGDIDNDGKLETVKWQKFTTTEWGDYYQLQVIDGTTIVWAGIKEINESNPYIFCSGDTGVSFPEILYDIDGDGFIELLAPEPQSDVFPIYFRKLRWKDRNFQKLQSNALMLKDKKNKYFTWQTSNAIYGTWISHFYSKNYNGLIKVDVVEYNKDETYRSGIALIKFIPTGAIIQQWIQPLKTVSNQNTLMKKDEL